MKEKMIVEKMMTGDHDDYNKRCGGEGGDDDDNNNDGSDNSEMIAIAIVRR